MGPSHLQRPAANGFALAHYVSGGTSDAYGRAHCIFSSLLPMASLGPRNRLGVASDSKDGPIAFSAAAADGFGLAHSFSGRRFRRPRMGPLHLWLLLPMASLWPFNVLGGASAAYRWTHRICSSQLRMASLGPINFIGGFADALEWAHCLCI